MLPRAPVRLRRSAALSSPRQLRRGGAVTAREAGLVVERSDGDCSDESGYGEHKSDYDCAAPIRAGDVAPVLIVLFHRSMSRRPRMGTTPRWPVVLGSDAGVMLGSVATNGEFLCSVKVIRAITTTIAARTAMMSPLPHRRRPRRVRSSLMAGSSCR